MRLQIVLVSVLATGIAFAQAPSPAQSTDPAAASTQPQRDVIKKSVPESPAPASSSADETATPHQKSAMKKPVKTKKKAHPTPPTP